jgi:hypothetical protein
MASIIKADTLQSTTSNVFVLNSAGTEYARFDPVGNMGIGTTGPSNFGGTNLQVANTNIASVVWTNGTYTGQLLASASSEVTIGSRSNHVLRFATNDTERARIDTSGNVGIGTTTPNFQISFGANIGKTIAVFENAGTSVYGIGMGGAGTGGDPYRTKLFANGTEYASITDAGIFSFNSGYGSSANAYGCRAWVNFDGTGTVAIRASGNVSSITDNGAGDYTVNFATAMPDNKYACIFAGGLKGISWGIPIFIGQSGIGQTDSHSTTRVRIATNTPSDTAGDTQQINLAIFR